MGALPPMRPMRSGDISHFFFAFRAICNPERQNETKSRFSSCRCAAACGSQEPATWATRGGFGRLSMPCHEPLQVPMWLWLPSSARRAIGDDGPDHDPSQVRQVVKRLDPDLLLVLFTQIAATTGHRPFFACRKRQIPLWSPLLFLPQSVPKRR